MSNRSLRNRSSRYSSPAVFAQSNGNATPPKQEAVEPSKVLTDKQRKQQQTRLDGWVEPAVRNGVPSFEDTKGLERLGVLEHMQPLGMPPTSKLLQKLKLPVSRSLLSARATPVQGDEMDSPGTEPISVAEAESPLIDSEMVFDDAAPVTNAAGNMSLDFAQQTPTISSPLLADSEPLHIQPQSINSQSIRPDPPVSVMALQDATSPSVVTTPPRGRPAKKDVEEMKVYTTSDDPNASQPLLQSSSTRQPRTATKQSPSGTEGAQSQDRIRGYLTIAINRAYRENNPELAAGLRRVMEESGRDEVFTALDNIAKYKQGVRLEQFKVFKRCIKKGIKEHRRSTSNSTPSKDTHGLPTSPTRSRPVAYVSSFHSKIKRPLSASTDPSVQNQNNGSQSPQKPKIDQSKTNHIKSIHPFPELSNSHYSTSESDQIDISADQHTHPHKLLSPKRERESSFSSLSSALSHPEDIYPDPKPGSPQIGANQLNQPTTTLVRRQGPIRQMAARETRSSDLDNSVNSDSRQQSHDYLPLIEGITPGIGNVNSQPPHTGGRRYKKNKIPFPRLSPTEARKVERSREKYEADTVPNYNYRAVEETSLRGDVELWKNVYPSPPTPPPVVISSPEAVPRPVLHRSPIVLQGDVVSVLSTPATTPATSTFPETVNGRKRKLGEVTTDDEDDNDTSAEQPESSQAPARRSGTRQSTPRVAKSNSQPPSKKARTMVSPRKSRDGANQNNGGNVDNDDAVSERQIDNEDDCWVCGASGNLICCDGCPKSYHVECASNPPQDLNDGSDWFCPECTRKETTEQSTSGSSMVRPVTAAIANMPAKAFSLPPYLQTYYEGVSAGPDGEYVEAPAALAHKKGQRTNNTGNVIAPDYKAERDSKGVLRTCYTCGRSTGGTRDLIPCDYCPHEFHLDCLPIPAAGPVKHFRADGQPTKGWRCPLHVNTDLQGSYTKGGVEIGQMGRQPKGRRPRGNVTTEPFVERRYVTNGINDIALAPDQPELGIKTVDMQGQTVRIPEQSVRLNFIQKARMEFYNDRTIPPANGLASGKYHSRYWESPAKKSRITQSLPDPYDTAAIVRLRHKPLYEQQAIITLQQMADKKQKEDGTRNIATLVDALITSAPPGVAESVYEDEEAQLQFFLKLATERLDIVRNARAASAAASESNVRGDTSPAAPEVAAATGDDETEATQGAPTTNGATTHDGEEL